MKNHCSAKRNQKGAVLAIFTIAMVVIIAIAGLALDMSHAYVDKTRMQNLLDAAALSAAMTLTLTGDPDAAKTDGRATLAAGLEVGDELAALADPDDGVLFEFSHKLDPFIDTSVDPIFVRASISSHLMQAWLIRIFDWDEVSLRSSAVAGPVRSTTCELAPFMVCGDPDDDDCLTNPLAETCFGYNVWRDDTDLEVECYLKSKKQDLVPPGYEECGPQADDTEGVGPGNFQLLDLSDVEGQPQCSGGGGAFVRCAANKGVTTCDPEEDIWTKTGGTVGPLFQGLNTNFGIYNGPVNRSQYPPDVVTDYANPDVAADNVVFFKEYKERLESEDWDEPVPNAENYKRVKPVVIGVCDITGHKRPEVLAIGCFYLTQPADQNGKQQVFGQFLGECGGGKNLDLTPSAFAQQKIILYKDYGVVGGPDDSPDS